MWPEFHIVWIFLAIAAVAFAIDAVELGNSFFLLVEGALLFVSFLLLAVTAYRAARIDRDTKVERGEFKNISETLDDALVVYDEKFRVMIFNAAAEHLFKLPAQKVIGHVVVPQDVEREGWRMLVQTIFPSLAPRVVVRSKEGEFAQVSDISFTDPQAELRVTATPIKGEAGQTFGFIKIIHDRTAQIGAFRAQSEFVTVASHQLRTPTTELRWAIQSLAHEEGLSPQGKEIVKGALQSAESMLRRIEELLNISRMEEGKFGYQFAEINIVDFLSKVLADVLPAAQRTGVKIYFDRPQSPLPNVMADRDRLSIALTNILENAIRYNVENGEVIVKVDALAGKPFLQVSVKDTGIGVPAESMNKLFTKFYRADNAMKSQADGSGLGLYMTKNIVMAHGGEIWAESELNRGTVVYFTLPTDPSLVPQHEVGTEELY